MELKDYRKEIDDIDKEIVSAFDRRMEIAGKIAEYKKLHGLPVLDQKREEKKLDEIKALSDEKFKYYIAKLYSCVFELSRDYQNRITDQEEITK